MPGCGRTPLYGGFSRRAKGVRTENDAKDDVTPCAHADKAVHCKLSLAPLSGLYLTFYLTPYTPTGSAPQIMSYIFTTSKTKRILIVYFYCY